VAASGRPVEVIAARAVFFNKPEKWDAYVVLGARDDSLSDFAQEIAERL